MSALSEPGSVPNFSRTERRSLVFEDVGIRTPVRRPLLATYEEDVPTHNSRVGAVVTVHRSRRTLRDLSPPASGQFRQTHTPSVGAHVAPCWFAGRRAQTQVSPRVNNWEAFSLGTDRLLGAVIQPFLFPVKKN